MPLPKGDSVLDTEALLADLPPLVISLESQWNIKLEIEIHFAVNVIQFLDECINLCHLEQNNSTVLDHDSEQAWKNCCKLFMIPYVSTEGMTEPQPCEVKAFKGALDDYQLRAVYWMLKTERLVGGGFLCDEMGLGKVGVFELRHVSSGWRRLMQLDSGWPN